MRKCSVFILGFVFFSGSALAQVSVKPKVLLSGAVSDEKVREKIQNNIADALHSINLYTRDKKPFSVPGTFETGAERVEGIRQLKQLADSTNLRFDERILESDLIELKDGNYEIRKVYVSVKDSIYRKDQEMVLIMGKDGFLAGARFAMAEHQYDAIISSATSLEDEYRRKQLISYLERFRTAYNKKDVDFIEQQFSDNALIITGTRVEVAKDVKTPGVKGDAANQEQFKLTRQTKQQYIANLRNRIFKTNAFINVQFEEIDIYSHPDYNTIYGVNLIQKWSTSNYSDVGYLFLMIDYTDELRPMIYVRAWQPESMIKAGNKVIDFDMFEIIK